MLYYTTLLAVKEKKKRDEKRRYFAEPLSLYLIASITEKSTACQRHFLCNPEDHLYSVIEYSKQKLSYCCLCLSAYTHLLQKPRGYQGEKASQVLTL